jgi:hypothetical protein
MVMEKFLMIKSSIKDKINNFKKIYKKIRNLGKVYESLIMTSILNINPDLAIARGRIYQDYIHECQMFLVEVPNLAEKLAIYLIQNDQHWFPAHVNIDVFEVYDKCFQENLTLTKNCMLRRSLTYFPMTPIFLYCNCNRTKATIIAAQILQH